MISEKGDIIEDRFGNLKGARFSFAGMNFMVDPADLPIEQGQCADICNCDVDNKDNVSRRDGFTQILSDNIDNAWSDGTETYCTINGRLTQLVYDNGTFAKLTISGVPILHNKVEFKKVNNIVVFSDGLSIGTLDNGQVQLFDKSYFFV